MTDQITASPRRNWGIVRVFDLFVALANAAGSIWIFAIMVLICADVTLRYVFSSPIPGVPLVITMSLIAIVFLQLPDALFAGRVTRNAALIMRILERRPKLGRALNALYYLIGAVFVAVLVYYGLPVFEKAWRTNSYLGNRGDFTLPDWPFKLLIVVGSALITIQYLRLAYANICACFGKSLAGLDVPELESLD